jgi:cytochrome b subunit of formate dehydrogenase
MKIKGISFEKAMQSPALKKEYDENPEKFIKDYVDNPINNIGVFKLVIWFIGSSIIICIVCSVIISLWWPDHISPSEIKLREVPDLLKMVASAAIGAITGLLVPTPTHNQNQNQ